MEDWVYEDTEAAGNEDADFNEALEFEAKIATVNALAAELARKAGFKLQPTDPEFGSVRWRAGSAELFLESYLNALNAKAARLGRDGVEIKLPSAGEAQRPSASASAGSGQRSGKRAQQAVQGANLMSEYRKAMDQLLRVGASSDEKIKLRQEFRRKGLNI